MDEFQSKYTGEEIENKLDGAIVFNKDMNLSEEEKARARSNIGVTENSGGGSGGGGTVTESFKILGYFSSLATLQQNVPNPEPGDAYGVGSSPPYDIYIWDGFNSMWVNNGPIQGPAGEDAEVSKDSVTSALGYTPVKSVNGKTGEAITLNANDVGAVATSKYLTANVIYRVSAEIGSDDNDGSWNKPFATLQKAIDSIPADLGGNTVEIYVISDLVLSDNESIEISNKGNGNIEILNWDGNNFFITGNTNSFQKSVITIKNCGATVKFINISVKQNGNGAGIFLGNNTGSIILESMTIVGAKSDGVASEWYSAGVHVYSPLLVRMQSMSIQNWGKGLSNVSGIVQMIGTNIISNNEQGVSNDAGLVLGNMNMENNNTNFLTMNGGRIYAGGQTSVPNY